MTHVPHELVEEFPDLQQEISDLKKNDSHFARLFDEYHVLNRSIHRAETNLEPTDDYHMSEMRKQRLKLKDEIAGLLSPA